MVLTVCNIQYVFNGCQHILYRLYDSSPNPSSPNGLFTEWTVHRMVCSPNGLFTEWTVHRMDSSPNGQFTEWTVHRMNSSPKIFYNMEFMNKVESFRD